MLFVTPRHITSAGFLSLNFVNFWPPKKKDRGLIICTYSGEGVIPSRAKITYKIWSYLRDFDIRINMGLCLASYFDN